MVRILSKLGIKGLYLNLVKGICERRTADIILNGTALKAFPLRSGTTQGCPLSPLQFNIGSNAGITQGKETKGIQIRKEEVKLFADGMFLYVKNLKEPTINY